MGGAIESVKPRRRSAATCKAALRRFFFLARRKKAGRRGRSKLPTAQIRSWVNRWGDRRRLCSLPASASSLSDVSSSQRLYSAANVCGGCESAANIWLVFCLRLVRGAARSPATSAYNALMKPQACLHVAIACAVALSVMNAPPAAADARPCSSPMNSIPRWRRREANDARRKSRTVDTVLQRCGHRAGRRGSTRTTSPREAASVRCSTLPAHTLAMTCSGWRWKNRG